MNAAISGGDRPSGNTGGPAARTVKGTPVLVAMMPCPIRLLPTLAALAVAPFALAQTAPPPMPPQNPPKVPQKKAPPKPGDPKVPQTPPKTPPADPNGGPGQNPGLRGGQRTGGPKPYDEVVTKEAKTDKGVFLVHRIDDKVLFEIPKAEMGKEMLLATEVAATPAGSGGYGGTAAGHDVVRWVRRGDSVFLRTVDYSARALGTGAIARAVEAASVEPIAAVFPVAAEGKDDSVVIDVTRFFTSDPAEFSVRARLGGGAPDPSRSYVERVKAFPTNVELTSTLTFVGGGAPSPFGGRPASSGARTALVHYSLVNLPEKPMMPREADARVGYFTEDFELYGDPQNRVVDKSYIARYRLEKKDPNAALSEPVKPIVYYISREVPEWLHPYFKKAVEDWSVAFEQAGFKNAIVCKEAPTVKEDPDWDPEDARYSVIRWAPTPTENAQGPHISDPRTGEILSAHIIVWHNVMKLNQTWYFTQVADLDPRAARLPLPQDLLGRLMQYVVSHEVGHTLGLRHNHKASSSYTVAQLRDKAFTDEYGDEASIMDYGRFNYVAQPGDGANLIPIIAPYDKFAIEWGYKPVPNAKSPDDEKRALDLIAARQVAEPMLRFGGEDLVAQSDPTVQTEDLGSDPIEATRYGLMNIDRIAKMLVPATTKYGEDYDLLRDTYADLVSQRTRELVHVTKLVGGVVETRNFAGRGGASFTPVPAAKQAAAVDFLVKNAFATPTSLLTPDLLYRIQPSGAQANVLTGQRIVLLNLLSPDKISRLQDASALGAGGYTVDRLVNDVQNGIWSELMKPAPQIDPYRRNLQRAYLEAMQAKLQAEDASPAPSDLRASVRGNLMELRATLGRALLKTSDTTTKRHLMDARTTVDRILTPPNVVTETAPTVAAPARRGG